MKSRVVLLARGPAPEYKFLEISIEKGRPIAPKGATTYYLRYSENGKRKVEPVGGDLTAAFAAYQNRELNQARVSKGLMPIESAASALIRDFKTGTSNQVTIADAVEQFTQDCHRRIQDWRNGGSNGLSPNSASAYTKALQNFAASCADMGAVNMSELQDAKRGEAILIHFKEWLHKNTKRRSGKAAHTDEKKFTVVSQFLAGYNIKMKKDRILNPADTGLLKRHVVPHVKKPKVGDIVYYTPADIKAMLSAASTVNYKNNNNKSIYDADDLRDLILVFLWTGMRDEEVQHLEWSDVIWKNGEGNGKIIVQDKPKYDWRVKDGEKREVKMIPLLREVLLARKKRMETKEWKESHRGQSETLIFSTSTGVCNPNFADHIGALQDRAELGEVERKNPTEKNRRPYQFSRPECRHHVLHLFRHTYATMLGVQGHPARNIQAALGHSDLTTTERYLAIVDEPEKIRKEFEAIGVA